MLPRPFAALVLVCTLTADSFAGTPREELLRYVPDDVGFCLVVQNLRGQLRELAGSPFGRRLRESAGAKALRASAEWGQLKQAEQYLERHLGVNAEKLFDDLLGEAFAFAYKPGPLGKQDDEQGLFLLRARDEKTLAGLVAKLNALQKETGELKSLDEVEHKGVKYVRRREAKETNYYYLNGPILLFSGQESLLRQAVEREKRAEGDSLLLRQMRELKLEDALVGLLLNPRAWDAAVAASKPADPAARMAVRAWKALGGVGVAVHLESDVRIQLSIQVKTEDLPASARKLLAAASKPSELWARMPENALLAISGRLDLAALYEFLGDCLTKQAKQTMEAELDRTLGAVIDKDVVKELLPALGPAWGVWAIAPTSEEKAWTPRVVAALKLSRPKVVPDGNSSGEPIEEAVLSAVRSAAVVAVLGHNKQHPDRPLRLRVSGSKPLPSFALQGDSVFPPGVMPWFGIREGYFVLASSSSSGLGPLNKGETSDGVPLLRANLKEWRAYLAAKREPLAGAVVCKDGLSKDKALAKIDELRAVLELFDRVEVRQQTSPGFAAFTLTLTPSAAMKALPPATRP